MCPWGTYNALVQGTTSSSCTSWDGGKYCKTTGLDAVSGTCDQGYYCTGGAKYKDNDSSLTGASGTGGYWTKGNFWPTGSTSLTTCTPGNYCSEDYLSAVSAPCIERYYCSGGTSAERPTSDSTYKGNICPAGNYCPTGSTSGTACAAGTYQPNQGAAASSECLACPPGKYCSATGLSTSSGTCTVGFYWEGGSTSPSPATAVCSIGYYCPAGSVQQILWDESSYQSLTKQGSCTTCSTTKYWFDTNTEVDWEAGYYWPGNNKKKACFPGNYGDTTALSSLVAACKTCPAGKAWEDFATNTNYKTWAGGYYCNTGAISSIPQSVAQGGARCDKGKYCPEGSSTQTSCPAGKYCEKTGLSEATGDWEAGYYCTGGTTQQNPTSSGGAVWPSGYYCPGGSSSPTAWPIGTYRDSQGGSVLSDWYPKPQNPKTPLVIIKLNYGFQYGIFSLKNYFRPSMTSIFHPSKMDGWCFHQLTSLFFLILIMISLYHIQMNWQYQNFEILWSLPPVIRHWQINYLETINQIPNPWNCFIDPLLRLLNNSLIIIMSL